MLDAFKVGFHETTSTAEQFALPAIVFFFFTWTNSGKNRLLQLSPERDGQAIEASVEIEVL